MSKIEAELLKATGEEDQGKREDRQVFLDRLAEAASKLSDAKWNKLTAEAQNWTNAANKSVDNKEEIEDFDDGGQEEEAEEERGGGRGRGRGGDDEGESRGRGRGRDEEEDDRPSRGRGRDAEEEDDDRGSRGRGRDDDRRGGSRGRDEEEERPRSRGGRDEEDDRPSRGRAREEEDERPSGRGRGGRDADEEERGGGRGRGRDAEADEGKGGEADENVSAALKSKIKNIILDNPAATVDAILKKLDPKVTVSKTTVSAIRTEFRHSLKVVQDAKLLKKAIL